jgi:cytochrome c-type biogenesis protein CcmF
MVGVVVAVGLFIAGVHHLYALVSFLLCAFVLATVAMEFYKGASAIRAKSGTNLISGMVELTHRNTRRYGGYIVHVGIVLMFVGFTGAAFNQDTKKELGPGESLQVGRYGMKLLEIKSDANANYRSSTLVLQATKNSQELGVLEPERRFYIASNQPTSEVAIRRRPNEDLYVNFAGFSDDGKRAVVEAYVFPLVDWIWMGYWAVLFGTIICLVPSKSKLVYPRTEVVEIAGKQANVGL